MIGKHFFKRRTFRTLGAKPRIIKQWWLYIINQDGSFEPLVGTYENKLSEAKKILF